ncbi:F8U17 [Hyposoter didymator ichnovirus]|nr:F8U12 [Hyposoter didymator ichnovirus]AIK25754.1 F8U17 [Hyposoter didymator ichnovirus]
MFFFFNLFTHDETGKMARGMILVLVLVFASDAAGSPLAKPPPSKLKPSQTSTPVARIMIEVTVREIHLHHSGQQLHRHRRSHGTNRIRSRRNLPPKTYQTCPARTQQDRSAITQHHSSDRTTQKRPARSHRNNPLSSNRTRFTGRSFQRTYYRNFLTTEKGSGLPSTNYILHLVVVELLL